MIAINHRFGNFPSAAFIPFETALIAPYLPLANYESFIAKISRLNATGDGWHHEITFPLFQLPSMQP
jgi:hypothetical protein